jgi:drug/metabolite transporter (DMT)-like permease
MIGATYASLFACIEPLASAFFSVIGLHLVFNGMDWIGAGLILATMFLLSWKTGEQAAKTTASESTNMQEIH